MSERKKKPRKKKPRKKEDVASEDSIYLDAMVSMSSEEFKLPEGTEQEELACFAKCRFPDEATGYDLSCSLHCEAPSSGTDPKALARSAESVFRQGAKSCVPVKHGGDRICVYLSTGEETDKLGESRA